MKKLLKITALTILGLIVLVVVCVWATFGSLVKGAMSVQKLDEGIYYMEYRGDDGFDEVLKNGGCESADDLSEHIIRFLSKGYYSLPAANPQKSDYGCSTLTARTPDGGVLMGRNFDFYSGTAMILHTLPNKGYESVSTFNINLFGFGEGWLPEGFANQYMALSCLFVALDGVNEKGFAIADLIAGDTAVTNQRTDKPDLTTTMALRYLLTNAASVDEALELLRSIDMHSDIGAAHHYAMSDASGRSVVVEYVDNQMVVTETQAVTNHYLCEQKRNVGLLPFDNRYNVLCEQYNQATGVMTQQTLTEAIKSVSQPSSDNFWGTIWTAVMDLSHPSVTYYSRRNFDKPFRFELERK